MPLDSSLRNAIIAISIIALLIVIVAITVLPIGQAQNASGAGGTFATTGGCGAGSFVTTIGNTTIACSAYPAQTNEYYGSCPANQFATAVTTTTLNCATALTTQTSAFFNYGSCPNAGMAATAITTTTLNCATFLTTQTSQVQTSAFFSYGSCPALENQFVNAITTTTLNCGASLGKLATASDPFYIISTLTGAFKQVGLAIYFKPNTTAIFINGFIDVQTNKTSCGIYVQFDYGTGTAPVQGVSQTGSLVGSSINTFPPYANIGIEAVVAVLITGLTAGITYWIDSAITSTPGNGCSTGNAEFSADSLVLIQM